jgi:hypothetical protein
MSDTPNQKLLLPVDDDDAVQDCGEAAEECLSVETLIESKQYEEAKDELDELIDKLTKVREFLEGKE